MKGGVKIDFNMIERDFKPTIVGRIYFVYSWGLIIIYKEGIYQIG